MRRVASKTRCPVCNRLFAPTRQWQRYDRIECRRKAYELRERDRIREEIRRELETAS